MPIITIQLVVPRKDLELSPQVVQDLADGLGGLFDCSPGSLWLRVSYLSRDQYAENQTALSDRLQPSFIEVQLADEPTEEMRSQLAQQVALLASSITERALENTHVIFAPAARGRIAFGGRLLT